LSAIRQILRQVKESGGSAIVYDPATDLVGEACSPERGDLILNPLDARCPPKVEGFRKNRGTKGGKNKSTLRI